MSILSELRSTLRGLLRAPGFTATTLALLTLGLGAAAVGATLLDRLLLHPLPAAQVDGLVYVESVSSQDPGSLAIGLCPPDALLYREQAHAFSSAGLFLYPEQGILTQDGGDLPVPLQRASWDLLATLGVRPLQGRAFLKEEDRPGGEPVALLGEALWKRTFAGDPSIVGRTIRMDDTPVRVVGVLPSLRSSLFPTLDDGLLRPLALPDAEAQRRAGGHVRMVARLAPGRTLQEAGVELTRLEETLPLPPWFKKGMALPRLRPLREVLVAHGRATGLLIQGITLLILLIACANVANLMLVRGLRRSRETALRLALGAGRGTLIGSFLLEGAILASGGALLALALQPALIHMLLALLPSLVPQLKGLAPGWATLGVLAVLASLATLGAAGLAAWRLTRHAALAGLSSDRSSPRQGPGTRALVALEVALAVSLLFFAILSIRSLRLLQSQHPGFETQGRVRVVLKAEKGAPPLEAERLLAQVRQFPGVQSASSGGWLPWEQDSGVNNFEVPRAAGEPSKGESVCEWVSGDHFRTLGIPLRQGRDFRAGDSEDVVIIDDTLARAHFPEGNAVGGRILSQVGRMQPLEVIGVAGAVRPQTQEGRSAPRLYFHAIPGSRSSLSLWVWGGGSTQALMDRLRKDLPPNLPGWRIAKLDAFDALAQTQTATLRGTILLLMGFTQVALLLAGFGLYSVLAYLAASRRKEWAIRRAVGAEARHVVLEVLRQAIAPVGVGLGLGLMLAFAGRRVLEDLLLKLQPQDPASLLLTLAGLALMATLASLAPALQALRVQPAEALRSE
ncbi:MAG: ABC transporter permease [Acidobacteria bacterium]|nr:ABC transporter permease [Acidobacteriota bacterium]MBI3487105.1 ABC transporter permease [Acidobacteriota bacterium]